MGHTEAILLRCYRTDKLPSHSRVTQTFVTMNTGSILPDLKIKSTRKLQGLLQTWQAYEARWIDLELVLDNLGEQLKAASGPNTDFIQFCKASVKLDGQVPHILPNLAFKINAAIRKTMASQQDLLTELEAHQKKFYQLRLEVERSLLGTKGILSSL